MPGLPVPHHLPKFTQVHVHGIGDAIQPSHPHAWVSRAVSRTERLCLHLEHFQGHGWRAESHFRGLLLRVRKTGDTEGREEQTNGAWVRGPGCSGSAEEEVLRGRAGMRQRRSWR